MIAIQFSGGKDSLAVLYRCRPMLPEATVYFGDTGIVYPHMREFVHETCRKLGANLKVVNPPVDILEFHHTNGLPSDIVPVESSLEMRLCSKHPSPTKLQSSLSCCRKMLWKPIYNAMLEDGVKTVFRGSKASDDHVGVPDGFVDENGITYKSPLWDWTDDDVFSYLKAEGAELPDHYATVNNSFDCILCSAFLNHKGSADRLEYTKRRYPEYWPELSYRLKAVRQEIDEQRASLNSAFELLEA